MVQSSTLQAGLLIRISLNEVAHAIQHVELVQKRSLGQFAQKVDIEQYNSGATPLRIHLHT